MAKNKTEEERKKEEMRREQLKILKSGPVKNIYLASRSRDAERYGKIGKATGTGLYLQALTNPDTPLSKLLAAPYIKAAIEAQKKGKDIYEHGAFTPIGLLENAEGFYQSAINGVKVRDVLDLMGISEVHKQNISEDQKDMYMEDFKKANEDIYNGLVEAYFRSVEQIGIGEAISESGRGIIKNLESILKEDPSKKEEKENKNRK